jgi:replication initiation protein RepC
MAFTRLSSSSAGAKPAYEPQTDTDIWATFRALRDARSHFGLRPGHIQTLQALLSFLKPGHGETVFASNISICDRVGGIDERTLRRHITRFVDLGFVERQDRTNRKRYRVRSSEGDCISFGLSLTPLLSRASELMRLADKISEDRQNRIFLRKQILAKLAVLESDEVNDAFVQNTRRLLRRKLSLIQYREILKDTDTQMAKHNTPDSTPISVHLPANDGQTVRHQSNSKKEELDKNSREQSNELEARALLSVCSEAHHFATRPLKDWTDIERHAQTIAPMMGIHPKAYQLAENLVGSVKAASAVFIILQLGDKVRSAPAYFQSITAGKKRDRFDPISVVKRLSFPSASQA